MEIIKVPAKEVPNPHNWPCWCGANCDLYVTDRVKARLEDHSDGSHKFWEIESWVEDGGKVVWYARWGAVKGGYTRRGRERGQTQKITESEAWDRYDKKTAGGKYVEVYHYRANRVPKPTVAPATVTPVVGPPLPPQNRAPLHYYVEQAMWITKQGEPYGPKTLHPLNSAGTLTMCGESWLAQSQSTTTNIWALFDLGRHKWVENEDDPLWCPRCWDRMARMAKKGATV